MLLSIKQKLVTAFAAISMSLSLPITAAESDNTRSVEIGAGGNIKLEKPYRTKIEEQFEWHAHTLWESRYVTEGRDNLSGDGLLSASTEFTYEDLSIIPWIANGVGANYTEFNLNVVYGIKLLDNLEAFAGYNFIQSRESGEHGNDNEVSLDLTYFLAKKLHFLASIYHSFDAGGTFAEVAVKKGYLINKALSISVRTVLGFNADYVADGHNGLNHAQLRGNIAYRVMDKLEVYAYSGYSLAINRDRQRYAGDELLRDFGWGGVGVTYRF